jgi:hypothetical protein
MADQFTQIAAPSFPMAAFRLELDPDDKDGQTLLFWYPAVTPTSHDYIRSAVKIESGAKSALDPTLRHRSLHTWRKICLHWISPSTT